MSTAGELIHDLSVFMPDAWKCSGERRSRLGPGQCVLAQSDAKRAVLAALKSDDLKNLRPDAVFPLSPDEAWKEGEKSRISRMLMAFDRDVLGIGSAID